MVEQSSQCPISKFYRAHHPPSFVSSRELRHSADRRHLSGRLLPHLLKQIRHITFSPDVLRYGPVMRADGGSELIQMAFCLDELSLYD
jgi:hypothetical protein